MSFSFFEKNPGLETNGCPTLFITCLYNEVVDREVI